jgi:hypothetical protein
MMYLWGDEWRHSRARFKPKKTLLFPGPTSQLKVNSQLFTTVWVLVGPVGGTAIKLPYMATFPVASVALP